MNIKNMASEERPREKMLRFGADSLSEAELIAIVLRTGTKDVSAVELASALLYRQNGLRGLVGMMPQELCRTQGMGIAKACEIVAAIELGRRIAQKSKGDTYRIKCAENVADLVMEEMRYYKKEVFKVILLDSKGSIISEEQISVGGLNSSVVHPREVFNAAVRRNAYAMVLLHNHPSGDPTPSSADIDITNRIIDAGRIMGINIIDHIVIGDGEYYSFKENDLI